MIVLPLLAVAPQVQLESVELESLVVRKLSPTGESAVVQYPAGEMKLVRQGETIPGTRVVVLQVLEDRLLARLEGAPDSEPKSGKWVWLHQATGQPLKSRVQILDREPPPAALLPKPAAETVKEELPPGAELRSVVSSGDEGEAADEETSEEGEEEDPPASPAEQA